MGHTVIMAGGRMQHYGVTDNQLWVSEDFPTYDFWRRISVSYVHNTLTINTTRQYDPAINTSDTRPTSGYVSLLKVSEGQALLAYDRLKDGVAAMKGPPHSQVFAVKFELARQE